MTISDKSNKGFKTNHVAQTVLAGSLLPSTHILKRLRLTNPKPSITHPALTSFVTAAFAYWV